MIDCSTAVRKLWDFIEKDLPADDQEKMDEHLAYCRRCCGEVEFAEEIRTLLKGASTPGLPEAAEVRLNLFIDQIEEEKA